MIEDILFIGKTYDDCYKFLDKKYNIGAVIKTATQNNIEIDDLSLIGYLLPPDIIIEPSKDGRFQVVRIPKEEII